MNITPDIHPSAAELLERDIGNAITAYGKVFFSNPANQAKFEAWLACRNELSPRMS